MKKIQAIFSDFDGTIVNTSTKIDKADIELIHQLKKAGVMFVGATGRHFPVARCFALEIGIENPYILCNGGIIYDYAEEKILEINPVDSSQLTPMIEFAEKEGIMCYAYVEKGVYMRGSELHEAVKKVIGEAGKYMREGEIWAEPKEKFSVEGKCVIKFLMPGCTDECRKKLLKSDMVDNSKFTAVFSGGEFLDINAKGVNKGRAMLEYCKRYNIDPEATIALGDNYNDVEMLQNSGIAVSPQNASDEIKKLADIITTHCDDKPFTNAIRLVREKYGDII